MMSTNAVPYTSRSTRPSALPTPEVLPVRATANQLQNVPPPPSPGIYLPALIPSFDFGLTHVSIKSFSSLLVGYSVFLFPLFIRMSSTQYQCLILPVDYNGGEPRNDSIWPKKRFSTSALL